MAHELMENDQMFSVAETPWHGLGRILKDAPTIEEALVAANLDWRVRQLPLFANQPPHKWADGAGETAYLNARGASTRGHRRSVHLGVFSV